MKLNPALIREVETDLVLRPHKTITLPTDVAGVVIYVVAYPAEPKAPLVERVTIVAEQLCAAFSGNPREDKPREERRFHQARHKKVTRRG